VLLGVRREGEGKDTKESIYGVAGWLTGWHGMAWQKLHGFMIFSSFFLVFRRREV
jgi:hypothetical protein